MHNTDSSPVLPPGYPPAPIGWVSPRFGAYLVCLHPDAATRGTSFLDLFTAARTKLRAKAALVALARTHGYRGVPMWSGPGGMFLHMEGGPR